MKENIFIRYRLPLYLYAALIFIVSSVSFPSTGSGFEITFTNLIHIVEYAIFAFLVYRALSKLQNNTRALNIIIFSIAISTLYGAFIEFYQSFVPGRGAQLSDCFFNLLGAGLGTIFYNRRSS